MLFEDDTHDINIAIKEDTIYGLFTMRTNEPNVDQISDEISNHLDLWDEIRTFTFENETLKETGVKWKSSKKIIQESGNFPWVTSKVFVQNVTLN